MEAETYQRALHLWSEWEESIVSSRRALGYDPTWPVDQAVAWIEEHYGEKIAPRARVELVRLALPPNLLTYWEDCFYCNHLRADGSVDFNQIRRRIAYQEKDGSGQETGRWLAGNRSLPALPFHASLMWYGDEDIHDPWLRIEVRVHASLISRDLLDSAMDQAWVTITQPSGFSRSGSATADGKHPLSSLITQAKANRSETKRRSLERWQRGEVNFEGLLAEEWQSNRVQQELQDTEVRYRGNPIQLRKMHRDLQNGSMTGCGNGSPTPSPGSPSKANGVGTCHYLTLMNPGLPRQERSGQPAFRILMPNKLVPHLHCGYTPTGIADKLAPNARRSAHRSQHYSAKVK